MSAEAAIAYHEQTRHFPWRYARSAGYMDWNTQPEPFRWYEGAPRLAMPRPAAGPGPSLATISCGGVAAAPVALHSVGQLSGHS